MRPTMVALGTAVAVAAAFASATDDAAVAAAHGWLATVDAGDYGRSWDQAAAYFRGAVGKPDWERAIAGVRSPLGRVLERKLRSATVARTLPGAPDGEYVVIQYDTPVRAQGRRGRDGHAEARAGPHLASRGLLHPVAERDPLPRPRPS